MIRKLGLLLLLVLIVIQFFHPDKNESSVISVNDITNVAVVPDDVQSILKTSCYDCHSNSTVYPWYYAIQPVAWWLNNHVVEGKEHLNFSEFGTYTPKNARHKLDEVKEVLDKNEMPLKSYTVIHGNAKLTAEQKALLTDWSQQTAAAVKN
jgi:hypothetical protein